MNVSSAINAYTKVSRESSINGTDSHGLITMLFQGALLQISVAKQAMFRKDPANMGAAISKAIAIVGEGLNASLNLSVGGELAQRLSALYTYMVGRLVEANAKNDEEALDEVARLLNELMDAWVSIRPQVVESAAPPTTARVRASA